MARWHSQMTNDLRKNDARWLRRHNDQAATVLDRTVPTTTTEGPCSLAALLYRCRPSGGRSKVEGMRVSLVLVCEI